MIFQSCFAICTFLKSRLGASKVDLICLPSAFLLAEGLSKCWLSNWEPWILTNACLWKVYQEKQFYTFFLAVRCLLFTPRSVLLQSDHSQLLPSMAGLPELWWNPHKFQQLHHKTQLPPNMGYPSSGSIHLPSTLGGGRSRWLWYIWKKAFEKRSNNSTGFSLCISGNKYDDTNAHFSRPFNTPSSLKLHLKPFA